VAATVGLIVNPAAGRDIRRLTGGASVSDDYAKRRTARCVLVGLTMVEDDIEVRVMPDRGSLGQAIVDQAPAELDVSLLEMDIEGTARDTQRAAGRFAEEADVVVVLGGDGTNRDVAVTVGQTPLVTISTGTNNVGPSHVEGTVAGTAAALVGTGRVPVEDATARHGMVDAHVDGRAGERRIRGLAAVGLLDRQFVGTRAILDASEIIGGVVSRASPASVGLPGIAGAVTTHRAADPGGVGFRLGPAGETPQTVRAITVPGVVSRLGVADWERLDDREPMTFEVPRGVLSIDGEREIEMREAVVDVRPVADGPYVVDVHAALSTATRDGFFVER
jgi:hypothetical protein